MASIIALPYHAGGTAIDAGLRVAREQCFTTDNGIFWLLRLILLRERELNTNLTLSFITVWLSHRNISTRFASMDTLM